MQNHAPPAFSKNTDRLNTPDLSENSVITPAIVQTNVESHKTMQTIEAVPNISEGQRPLILNKLATAVKSVKHVALLDLSADISHNRSVLTILGCPESVLQALTNLYEITTARSIFGHTVVFTQESEPSMWSRSYLFVTPRWTTASNCPDNLRPTSLHISIFPPSCMVKRQHNLDGNHLRTSGEDNLRDCHKR